MATRTQIKRRGRLGLILGTLVAALMLVAMAYADNVQVNGIALDIPGGTRTLEVTKSSTSVSSASFNLRIQGNSADGQSGCNVEDGTPATLSLVGLPAGVSVVNESLGGLTFSVCGPGGAKSLHLDVASTTVTGSFPITVNVSDGCTSSCGSYDTTGASFTLKVNAPPNTAPVLTVPASFSVEGNTIGGANVTFSVSATDAEDNPDPSPTCDKSSGAFFGIGATTVNCSVTDSGGLSDSDSFTVTVVDTTAPVVTVPADITEEATSAAGAVVTYTASATDIVDGAITPTCAPASGSTFALGTTSVSCSATDNAGNTGSDSFDVTVEDTTPPVVTVPADITEEATSAAGAVVTYTASATDIVDGAITPTCAPASGSTFALGTTSVTCSATDNAGNTGSDSFDVTVEDTTPPVVTVPADITEEATSAAGAVVTYTASATDIVDGAITPTCAPASGSTFALGTTSVTCSATDNAGNTGSDSFDVTVEDTTPPTLSLPANITTPATGISGAVVTYSASASDLVDGVVPVSCSPASGSTFAPGTTTVNCSATDAAGNSANGSFTVTVHYSVTGFYQPVDMTPASSPTVWNTVKNGSTVPLKFEVFAGSTELTDTAIINQPLKATGVACASGTADDIELTSTGGTSLRYDTTGGQFIYNWQTPKKVGSCYLVTVSMTDGSSLSAYFKLK